MWSGNYYAKYGRQLRGNDKKTVRREGIEPIKRVFTYVLFSVTHFLYVLQPLEELLRSKSPAPVTISSLFKGITLCSLFLVIAYISYLD